MSHFRITEAYFIIKLDYLRDTSPAETLSPSCSKVEPKAIEHHNKSKRKAVDSHCSNDASTTPKPMEESAIKLNEERLNI